MKTTTRNRLDLSRDIIVHGVEQLLVTDTRKAVDYLEHIDSVIATLDIENLYALQGERGLTGYAPIKGIDYYTTEEISEAVSEIQSKVKDGYTPVKGKDYFTPEEISTIKLSVLDVLSKSLSNEISDSLEDKEKGILELVEKKIKELESKITKDKVIFDPNKNNYYQVSGAGTTSSATNWGSIGGTLSDQTDLQTALNAKQDTLVSGTNIKTVNGVSVLGPGDIPLPNGTSINNVSTDQTITLTDGVVVYNVDASGGNVNITLPALAANTGEYFINKVDSSLNTVTLVGVVNGQTNPTLDFQYDNVILISNLTTTYLVK